MSSTRFRSQNVFFRRRNLAFQAAEDANAPDLHLAFAYRSTKQLPTVAGTLASYVAVAGAAVLNNSPSSADQVNQRHH